MFVFLLACALIGSAGYLGYRWDRPLVRKRRQLRRAPRLLIAAHAEGTPQKIVGKVVAIELLVAPISRRECVYYRVDIIGHSETRLRTTLASPSGSVPFFVTDESGRARIDPEGATLLIESEDVRDIGGWGKSLQARHHIFVSKECRYRETLIVPGATIAVAGLGVRVPDPDPAAHGGSYREGATMLEMSSSAQHPLVISD